MKFDTEKIILISEDGTSSFGDLVPNGEFDMLPKDLRQQFGSIIFGFKDCNTKTNEERNAILRFLKTIIDNEEISYIHKLRVIGRIINSIKDYDDDFNYVVFGKPYSLSEQ